MKSAARRQIAVADRLPLGEEIVAPDVPARARALGKGIWPVAGCDEAGRGPLAGPVVAAAVILDPETHSARARQFQEARRRRSARSSIAKICASAEVAVAFGVDRADRPRQHPAAPRCGRWRARCGAAARGRSWCMSMATTASTVGCDCEAVVSGDALVLSIAAASIVAKVTRDRLMMRLGAAHPGYGFERHMGYSVPEHFAALSRLGPTIHHRRSFAPVAALYGRPWPSRTRRCRCNPQMPVSAARACISRPGNVRGAPLQPPRGPARDRGLDVMVAISLFVELLRTRPRLLFWVMVATQAVLWTLVPRCFLRRRLEICRWCLRSGTNSRSAPNSARRSPSGWPRSRSASAACSASTCFRRSASSSPIGRCWRLAASSSARCMP